MATKKTPSDLENHLGYWLRYVSNHVSHAFASKVESHGVTVAEWVVLRALFDAKDINPSRLADIVGMSRGAISKLVERLCQKELIARTFSDGDRRYQTIRLTAKGKRLVPVLAGLADDNDREFFGHLTSADKRSVISLLQEIVRQNAWKDLPVD